MYIILDVAIVFLIVAGIISGIKKGFIGLCFDVLGYFLFLGLAGVVATGLLALFYRLGAVDSLAIVFYRLIGSTNSLFEIIGTTSQAVSFYISAIIVFLISFVVAYIAIMFLFRYVADALVKLRDDGVIRTIDNILGVALNLAVTIGLIWVVFSFSYSFNGNGILIGFNEVIRACPISGFIYKYNPLNGLWDSLTISETLKTILQ